MGGALAVVLGRGLRFLRTRSSLRSQTPAANGPTIARQGGRLPRSPQPLRHRRGSPSSPGGDLHVDVERAAPVQRLDQSPGVARDSVGRAIFVSPAPSVRLTVASATVTRRCLRGGAAAGVAVAVAVIVHVVSQPTRSGSVARRHEAGRAQRRAGSPAGRAGAGSVGSFGGGGLPTGERRGARRAAGAASANCWTRLLSVSVTVSVPRQSTLTPVGWMNSPRPAPRAPKRQQPLAVGAELPGCGCCRGRRPRGCRRRRARSAPGDVELAELVALAAELVDLAARRVVDRRCGGCAVGDVDAAAVGRDRDAAHVADARRGARGSCRPGRSARCGRCPSRPRRSCRRRRWPAPTG